MPLAVLVARGLRSSAFRRGGGVEREPTRAQRERKTAGACASFAGAEESASHSRGGVFLIPFCSELVERERVGARELEREVRDPNGTRASKLFGLSRAALY